MATMWFVTISCVTRMTSLAFYSHRHTRGMDDISVENMSLLDSNAYHLFTID